MIGDVWDERGWVKWCTKAYPCVASMLCGSLWGSASCGGGFDGVGVVLVLGCASSAQDGKKPTGLVNSFSTL